MMETESIKLEVDKKEKKKVLLPPIEKLMNVKYFECSRCSFKEKYQYYGSNPPTAKNYIFLEDSYVIENPFLPPKQGDLIVLGSHCVICKNSICKDTSCSIYYGGTYCIECAKSRTTMFPKTVQDKLNKIIKDYLGPLLLLVSFCYVRYIDYCY